MGDPNWFLSTIVQASATIVAILAGFLVTKIMSVTSERHGLQTRLIETQQRLRLQREHLGDVEERIVRSGAEDFLDNSREQMIASRGSISLERLIDDVGDHGCSIDELRPYYEHQKQTIEDAYSLFERKHPFPNTPPDRLQDYLVQIGVQLEPQVFSVYEEVYEILRDEYIARLPRHPFDRISGPFPIRALKLPFVNPVYSSIEARRFDELLKQRDGLSAEIQWLESQELEIQDRLMSIGSPPGVWIGLWLLVYLAIVGVVVPLTLLPITTASFPPSVKWGIWGLFCLGLLGVLGHMLWMARTPPEW